jgi:hypothetical protein
MSRLIELGERRLREELLKGQAVEAAEGVDRILRYVRSLDFASLISLAAMEHASRRREAEPRSERVSHVGASELATAVARKAEVRELLGKAGASNDRIQPFLEAFFTPRITPSSPTAGSRWTTRARLPSSCAAGSYSRI